MHYSKGRCMTACSSKIFLYLLHYLMHRFWYPVEKFIVYSNNNLLEFQYVIQSCCSSDEMTSSILLEIPWTFEAPIFIVIFRSFCRRKFCFIRGCVVVFLAFEFIFRVMGCWPNSSPPTWRTR